ncbi:MAG: TOBE domain-containing protein, partial [Chloroflexota bacterium]
SAGSDLIEVELTAGRRVRAPANGLASGLPVRVGVRPEKLRLQRSDAAESGDSDVNSVDGRIIDASYIGVSTQYVVKLDDDKDVVVYTQNLETSGVAEQHAAGEQVHLSWKPKHTFVIPMTAAAAPEQSSEPAAV